MIENLLGRVKSNKGIYQPRVWIFFIEAEFCTFMENEEFCCIFQETFFIGKSINQSNSL